MQRSEEAYYKRMRGKQTISQIARDMDVSRKAVTGWIDSEINKRENSYSIMRTFKKLLGVIE